MKHEDLVKHHSAEIIEKMMTVLISKEPVEVHFDFEDNNQWAVVTAHLYDEDKEISVQLHADDRYELHYGYYNDNDEFLEIVQPLTEEEKKRIPERLRKVMKKVLADEEGMRLPVNFLAK